MATGHEMTRTEGQQIERTSQRPAITPPIDVYENADEVLVVADVPGASQEGLNLRFERDQLTIEASTSPLPSDGSPLFREFGEADYRRTCEFAPGIDADKISAELSNGTLKIHLPKSAGIKPRRIPISSS